MAACSSSAASGKKRKRVVLTIEDKLKVCDLVKNGRSMTSAAAEFNVGKSTVHDIVKNQAKLQTFLTEIQDGDCIKKRRIVRRANLEALDKAVYLWFVQQRCKGTPISGPLLMGKALQLHPLVYPDDPDPTSFKAGTGWLKRFKDRHGVRALSVQGESQSAATASVDPFKEKLQKIIEEKGLTLNQVFNCDETGLYWKLMPNKTLVTSREKEAKGFKKPKDRVTLMACANASGLIKLPLVFVHKSLNPRCFKNLDKNDLPVEYYAQKNSWMDSSIFKAWFHEKFVPSCRKALGERGLTKRAILLLDNAPSHPDVESLCSSDGEIFCLYLPPNTTSLIQPMDQGVLETIKRRYKRDLLLRLLNEENEGLNIAEFRKTLNILDAVLMSAKSWSEVEESTIARSWSKLLSLSDVPECEASDTSLQIDMVMDEIHVPAEERSDWLTLEKNDPGYHEYTDEELVTHVREESEENDDEDDDSVVTQTVSHSQACQALETVLVYLEQQPEIPMSTTVLLNSLLIQTARKRFQTLKQTRVCDYFEKCSTD